MTIGEAIAFARKQNNISQEELANKLNVSRQSVSLWETNQTYPTLDKLQQLCEVLKVSANFLLGKEELQDVKIINQKLINDEKKKNNYAKVGFSFGIISLIFWLIPINFMFSFVGIVFSILGIKSKKNHLAIIGLVLSIVFFIAMIIGQILNSYINI